MKQATEANPTVVTLVDGPRMRRLEISSYFQIPNAGENRAQVRIVDLKSDGDKHP